MNRKPMNAQVLPHLDTNLIGVPNRIMSRQARDTMCHVVALRALDAARNAGGSVRVADLIKDGNPIGLGRAKHEIGEGIDYGEELGLYSYSVMSGTLTATP